MRPVNLIISAFGPYAKRQELDFEKLNGRNIFVITGTTGAGKTTIFDAISYALYGEASGESRENDSLRSHFAESDVETFVELDFELRGEVYKIRRSPKQPKKKVRGEGFTEKDAEAVLEMPKGKVISGVNNVNEKINEILGINKAQFKQIVMLPQGEFKKLLLANSVEREDVFRKIFNTYNFESIQKSLKEKALNLSKDRNLCKDRMKTHLNNIQGKHNIQIGEYIDFLGVINELNELIAKEEEAYRENESNIKRIKAKLEEKNKEKLIAVQNNEMLIEKEQSLKALDELLLKKESIEKSKILSDRAKKAKEVSYIEKEYIEKANYLSRKETEENECNKNVETLKEKLVELQEAVKNEENKGIYRDKLSEEIGHLKTLEPKIRDYDNIKKLILELEKKSIEVKELINKKDEETKLLKTNKDKREQELKDISELQLRKVNLDNEIENKTKLINEARDAFKTIDLYEKLKVEHNKIKDKYLKQEDIFKKIKHEYEHMEDVYRKEQAGILADSLKDGEACPVCGSLNHPNKAVKSNDNIPTEEELKSKKAEFEKHQLENNNTMMELTKINSEASNILENCNKSLSKLSNDISINPNYDSSSKEEVKNIGINLKSNIEVLNNEIKEIENKINKKEDMESELLKIDGALNKNEELINSLKESDKDIYAKLQANKASLEELERDIPKDIISVDCLNKTIDNKVLELENSKNRLKLVIKNRDESLNMLEGEKAKVKEIIKNIKEASVELNEKNKLFIDSIKTNGFESKEDYIEAKEYIEKINDLDKEIESYNNELSLMKEKNKTLNEKCKDLISININVIDEEIKEIRKEEELKTEEVKNEHSILQNNKNVLKKVIELNKEFNKKEEEYKVIGELADLANGKKSPYISFERYVLASYFQDIIDAANLRLEKMTGERFSLKRKTSKSKGAGQKGLELEIYDNYTASSRDVSSLSGGESFKASLSLALGLSDVVQASSGGVSLETMFVDEGFGTLDPQSLDNAIDSLLELQKGGRLVGIISHVQELKERVDAKIEVVSTKEGSTAKFNIL
ncbi:AAA family ATPase [Clostridium baratii]|uniref:Nuclease SbcCD subunit C n=1 Tax=Clostridium baratii TaxID=1561 RepID=A0A174UC99_9CLOT|nr:AAA family ATPase [Clostridium baratii]CUQ19993.1 exonuclease SbcC [Clostridium baratii]